MSTDQLRQSLIDQIEQGRLPLTEGLQWIAELERLERAAHAAAATPQGCTDIAVIGMSGRFPGAPDLNRFAANLAAGVDAVAEVPADRWSLDEFYDPDPAAPNRTACKWGGFLDQIDQFDPLFFRIAPKEAEIMDPQQRLFLETAWSALEDAGYSDRDLSGRRCGVFVGAAGGDFGRKVERYGIEVTSDTFFGNTPSLLPSRICYFLNLKGSALTLDTACSSSLVATHLACKSLIAGDNDMMIAGGVCVINTESLFVMLSKNGMLSPSGRCRAFDDGADGMVLAEGVGAVVLKRLDRALADGDRIDAVIKGSAINQDGTTNGIAAPCGPSQTKLEQQVYQTFGIDPNTIELIEAHGTGTPLGDPIELRALHDAFRQSTDRKAFCAIGSVKTNIGHAQTAAGIASLIKVVLALRTRTIFPTLHVQQETRRFNFAESPFYVAQQAKPWRRDDDQPRRAAVSSFGASGTNCHVVLEEAPTPIPATRAPRALWPVVLSAKRRDGLRETAALWATHLAANQDLELGDVAFTACVGRSHFRYRAAFLVRDSDELNARLQAFAQGDDHGVTLGDPESAADGADPLQGLDSHTLARRLADDGQATALLEQVLAWFVAGGDPDWSQLFAEAACRRVALPTYPFHRRSYWPTGSGATAVADSHGLDSLLDENHSDLSCFRFTKRLKRNAFYLDEHRVDGTRVLPGVTYLEMALQAARRIAPQAACHSIQRHTWVAPVQVTLNPVTVTLTLETRADGFDYRVTSPYGGRPVLHAQGRLTTNPSKPALRYQPVGAAATWIDGAAFYATLTATGMLRGPRFQTVRRFALLDDGLHAELELPLDAAAEFGAFHLHPGLADGLLQCAAPLLQDDADDAFWLPFSLGRLSLFAPLEKELRVVVRRESAQGRVRSFAVSVFSTSGSLLAEIADYRVRRLNLPTAGALPKPPADLTLISRVTTPIEAAQAPASAPLVWIADDGRAPNHPAVTAALPARDLERLPDLLNDAPFNTNTDLHLIWRANGDAAPQAVAPFLLRLHALAQTLTKINHKVALVVAVSERTPLLIAAASFLRVLAAENRRVQCRLVFLAEDTPDETRRLIDEIPSAGHAYPEIHYRAGQRHATTLQQRAAAELHAWQNDRYRNGGVYLVTGGRGGVGRQLVAYLLQHLKARVLVIGRNQPDPVTASWFDELAARGGAWRFEAADVADTAKLKGLVADLHQAFGALHGVFHCAGITRDAMLAKKSRDDFEAVLRPKIDGTIALHEALANHPLDFMALFSSSGSMIANPGQADYAAANRFLDAFAAWRNQRVQDGLCHGHTLALSWPLWAEGGMRLPEKAAAALEKRVGMRALESADGMAALRLALAGDGAHFGVFYGDTARIVAAMAAEPAADSRQNNDETQIVDNLAHAWVTHVLKHIPALPTTATPAGARTFAALQQLCNRPDHHRPSRELAEEKSPLAFTGVNVDGDRLVAHTQQLQAEYPAQREALALYGQTARHLAALLHGGDAAALLAPHAAHLAKVAFNSALAECSLFGFFPDYWSFAEAGDHHLSPKQRRQVCDSLSARPTAAPPNQAAPQNQTGAVDRAAVTADLSGVISRLTKVGLEDLDPHGDLSDYGMDSVVLTELANHINDNYGTEWTPADFFEFASIAAFVDQLCTQLGETPGAAPAAAATHVPSTDAAPAAAPIVSREAPMQHADAVDLNRVVADLLAGEISRAMKIPLEEVDLHGDLSDYGFDSVTLTELANLLNDLWDTDLSAATFFEFESIGAFARFLVDSESPRIAAWHQQTAPQTTPVQPVPTQAPAGYHAAAATTPPHAGAATQATSANLIDLNQPIAVIGKSAVFPGDNDLEAWWQKILDGAFMVGEIPESRFDWRAFFGDAQLEGEKLHSCWGGFIDEIDKFDAEFFKISPREAALMDPQHRLFLELTWRAIEDAAIAPRSLAGSRTGIFVGVTNNDYSEVLAEHGLGADAHAPTGNAHCLVPNRISYLLNFKGPSEPTDTACSSSLVAIHRAVRALQTGECSLAVAGGINVLLSPSAFIAFSKSGNMLARDGRCKTFDAGADGYVRGEGAGAVVLKTLADARRDGDPIYAVIRGTAVNHGGHAASLTAPNPNAQAELLLDAYRQADFDPQHISHIEVHGTGTQLGDPIEINGLKKAFTQLAQERGTALDQATCGLSSIKSNIGHLEGAAGVAGFIKILLAMRDRRLPKTLHFNQLNPNIRMQDSPFYIINEPRSWQPRPGSTLLRAGVSSFGFGGANAHIALESHDEYRAPAAKTAGPHLFVFSANKATSLRDLLTTFKTWLTGEQGRAADCADIAHTLHVGRDAMRVRLAFTAADKQELLQQIEGFLAGTAGATRAYSGDKPPRVADPATLAVTSANLAEAVQRFAAGDNLDLTGLGANARRIHLPTYHFLRKRHWAGEGPGATTTTVAAVNKAAAPKAGAFAFAAVDLGEDDSEQETTEAAPSKSYGPFKPMNAALIESQKSGANLSQRKRAYLAAFTEHFCAKNAASKQHAQQHRAHYADQRAVAFFHPTLKELCFPLVMDRCEGAEIWDIDGNHYVDIAMDFGCNLFGHRAPFLVKAMEQQLQRGLALGMRPASSSQAAELLCRLTGHERAVFTQSGTEAVMTAIRLARHATGRKKIVIFANSYHGHSDGVLAYGMIEGQHLITKPIADAIPPGMVKEVVVLDYNAPASLDWIRNHRDQLAAVVSEPMQSRGLAQRPGAFLRELRRVTEAADVALIFDEMITGFRVHPGGSQAYFGVRADLCTYGKILGGGIGQGAVAGKKRFLDAVDGGFWQYGDESYPPAERTFFAGTHSQNALGMAAAEAVLRRLEQVGPALQETLNGVCADMAARINQFFQAEEVPMMVQYFGSLFRFEPNGPINPIDQSLFVYTLRDKGVMISEIGNNFLSTAHTPAHIDRIVATVADTIADLRQGGYLPRRKPARAPIIPDPPFTATTAPTDDSFFS